MKSQKNYSIVTTAHPFTGMHITEKGLDYLENYVKEVREVIGYDVPLAIDHFGHVCVEDCIRFARRMEPYNLAWIEVMVPWMYTDQYVGLKNSTTILVCTGEDTEGKAEAKNGECNFRGFYGTYNITVNYRGKTKTVTADFSKQSDNNMAFDI